MQHTLVTRGPLLHRQQLMFGQHCLPFSPGGNALWFQWAAAMSAQQQHHRTGLAGLQLCEDVCAPQGPLLGRGTPERQYASKRCRNPSQKSSPVLGIPTQHTQRLMLPRTHGKVSTLLPTGAMLGTAQPARLLKV